MGLCGRSSSLPREDHLLGFQRVSKGLEGFHTHQGSISEEFALNLSVGGHSYGDGVRYVEKSLSNFLWRMQLSQLVTVLIICVLGDLVVQRLLVESSHP